MVTFSEKKSMLENFRANVLKDVCAQKFPRTDFLKLWLQVENDKIVLETQKKNRGSPNSFWR